MLLVGTPIFFNDSMCFKYCYLIHSPNYYQFWLWTYHAIIMSLHIKLEMTILPYYPFINNKLLPLLPYSFAATYFFFQNTISFWHFLCILILHILPNTFLIWSLYEATVVRFALSNQLLSGFSFKNVSWVSSFWGLGS